MDYEELILARQDSTCDECTECDMVEKCRKGELDECVYW